MAEGDNGMTGDTGDTTGYEVGYRKPPAATQFRKGQSGNPGGRPPGRRPGWHSELPYEAVLGQMVTVRENGVERHVTAAEAFLLQLTGQGLEGDAAAARLAMPAIEQARAARRARDGDDDLVIVVRKFGSINPALAALRMARKLDRFRPTARMVLEPWIVEAALDRLGDRRLTIDQQHTVVRATRTPKKVNWPHWWEARP